MNVSSAMIARAPSLDALKIYAYLLGRFGGAVGSVASTSYEALASWLADAKLTTERGAAFTVAVVRKRLAQLEKLGVVVLEKIKGAFFALTFQPFETTEVKQGEEPEPVDFYGGRTLFDSISETTSETKIESKLAPQEKKDININKLINKRAREEGLKTPNEADDKPTPDDAASKVDKTTSAFGAFRSKVATILREPTLRSDLVDRITVAVARKFITPQDALALCRRAVESRELWTRSGGQKGVKWAWQDVTPHVIEAYKNAGYAWTPTKPGIEPDAKLTTFKRRFKIFDNSGREIEERE